MSSKRVSSFVAGDANISAISRPYLGRIPAVSRLYLGYISAISHKSSFVASIASLWSAE